MFLPTIVNLLACHFRERGAAPRRSPSDLNGVYGVWFAANAALAVVLNIFGL